MNNNKPKLSVVQESNDGLWVWRLPDGNLLQDGHGNVFNLPGTRWSIAAQSKLKRAVNHLGIEEGKPEFMQNQRRLTQSEWEDQMARKLDGKIPDWHDPAVYEELQDREDRR